MGLSNLAGAGIDQDLNRAVLEAGITPIGNSYIAE